MKRFAYAAVMLIVLGVVLTGCRGERLSLDELLNRGVSAAQSGDWEAAKDFASRAVKVALEASAAQVASVWTIYSLCSATCSADAADSEALAEAAVKWTDAFASLPRPLTAVIIGGAIKNKPFTAENARLLGRSIRKIKEQTGGSILITTSRRTGIEAENIIKKEIEGIPAYTYWWGEKKDNPIMGFWALADNIIATGDSVSMPCECCGSGKPVLLFTGNGWLTPKHERFVQSLIDGGYAVHIDAPDALSFRPQKTLNPARQIAEKIDNL